MKELTGASAGLVPAKKVPAKKVPAKKVPTKKVPAKKAPAKKVPAKKVPAKKVPAKKAPVKKAPAKKVAAKKAPVKKAKRAAPQKNSTAFSRRSAKSSATSATPGPGSSAPRLPALAAPPNDPLIVLGLRPQFTVPELRRAWRDYAATHHPDTGGDAATFGRGRHAYETLRRGARQ